MCLCIRTQIRTHTLPSGSLGAPVKMHIYCTHAQTKRKRVVNHRNSNLQVQTILHLHFQHMNTRCCKILCIYRYLHMHTVVRWKHACLCVCVHLHVHYTESMHACVCVCICTYVTLKACVCAKYALHTHTQTHMCVHINTHIQPGWKQPHMAVSWQQVSHRSNTATNHSQTRACLCVCLAWLWVIIGGDSFTCRYTIQAARL